MATVIRTRIIRIGNSQGIRIPKLLLEQVNLGEDQEIELEVQPNQIVVRPSSKVRSGWEASFKKMATEGDDQLLDDGSSASRWDEEEWEW